MSILIAIDITLMVFFFQLRGASPPMLDVSSGFAGLVAGLLGFGCAACGSVFSLALLSSFGAGLATLLPFHGLEIGWLSILLLILSSVALTRAINSPAVCPI